MKKDSRPNEASSGLNSHRGRTIPVAMLLILVVLLSASSGIYAGASYFAQQAPGVTVTTTLFTTTTSWTTSTIWSTVTEVVQGILTTVQYTTSTSTVTVTGSTSYRTGKIVTANGNAQISIVQSKFGGASGYFAARGDRLSTPDSADWTFGTADYTVDFWLYYTSYSMFAPVISVANYNMNPSGFGLWFYNGRVYYSDEGTQTTYTLASLPSANAWHHWALVRSSGTTKLYIDGASVYSGSLPTNDGAGPLYIMGCPWTSASVIGSMDELRISKGVARWTGNFAPPTSGYIGDSSTVLLLHMDGADGSTTFIDDVTTG